MSADTRRWRIGILGAGALGTLLAYQLKSHTSEEVWLLARHSFDGPVAVEGEPPVALPVVERAPGPLDLLIVLVKAYATGEAIRWAAGAVGPDTLALTLQNGLGNGEALAEAVGPDRVLAGSTARGAVLLAPGQVRRGGSGPTVIAPWRPGGPASEQAPLIAALLSGAGFPTEAVADPQPPLWAKLAVNCGINALTAILGVSNGELLERPDACRLLEAAAREAGAVAGAVGIRLKEDPVARTLAVARATAANRSSMFQDLERGRRTEIDAINGAVSGRGRALGVPTPVNDTLTALVRALTP
jgi:2-dehydropantoate 2-reductase